MILNKAEKTPLKVSSKTDPNKLAGAIAGELQKERHTESMVIGAGALNQAVKAVAIARGFVAPGGIDVVMVPSFVMLGDEDSGIKTAIRLEVREEK